MKDLLKLEGQDLLEDKRVKAAIKGLLGVSWERHMPYPYCCIENLAFKMRDACEKRMWFIELEKISRPYPLVTYSTSEQWIIAAVLVWEAAQRKDKK